jgi:two-component system phosphate regulon response regulator PhoB
MRRCNPQLNEDAIELAGVTLNPATRRVTCAGRDVELGDIEFRMLHFFMTHPERIHSRAQLLDEVWGRQVFVEERTVDVHVRRLRQVLEPAGLNRLFDTVRGVGYRFRRSLPETCMPPGGMAESAGSGLTAQ